MRLLPRGVLILRVYDQFTTRESPMQKVMRLLALNGLEQGSDITENQTIVCSYTCYLCYRSRMFIIRPSSRTGRAIPASFGLKRFNRWPSLSAGRKWHLGVLLCRLWWPMVLHSHFLHGPVTHGSRNNTAVHPWARVYWWKCTPEVVTSVSCCFFLPDFAGAWAGVYLRRFAVEYLHWHHAGKYVKLFLSVKLECNGSSGSSVKLLRVNYFK